MPFAVGLAYAALLPGFRKGRVVLPVVAASYAVVWIGAFLHDKGAPERCFFSLVNQGCPVAVLLPVIGIGMRNNGLIRVGGVIGKPRTVAVLAACAAGLRVLKRNGGNLIAAEVLKTRDGGAATATLATTAAVSGRFGGKVLHVTVNVHIFVLGVAPDGDVGFVVVTETE